MASQYRLPVRSTVTGPLLDPLLQPHYFRPTVTGPLSDSLLQAHCYSPTVNRPSVRPTVTSSLLQPHCYSFTVNGVLLQLSSHSFHANVGSNNHVTTISTDKHCWFVDLGLRVKNEENLHWGSKREYNSMQRRGGHKYNENLKGVQNWVPLSPAIHGNFFLGLSIIAVLLL
jgi:hypothetical protein